ncbi:MAG: glycoside hydrolase family protein [Bryobacterales bacterium]|nr:glycoside hydrolase family protein [Bryobacterales bacterium]
MVFTGRGRDAETGLDYFGARYFSGAQGRWTTPDWPAKPQPVPYADLSNPQSLNLYAYVRNNPVTNRDPDGHWCLAGIGTTCDKNVPPPPKPPPAPSMRTEDMLKLSQTARTLSPERATFIRSYERFRPTAYKPTANDKPTIGYGHVIKPGENFEAGVTHAQGEALFAQDARQFTGAVNRALAVWVPQQAFDAFVSLSFNIGGTGFAVSSLATQTNALAPLTQSDFTQYSRTPKREHRKATSL